MLVEPRVDTTQNETARVFELLVGNPDMTTAEAIAKVTASRQPAGTVDETTSTHWIV